MHQDPDVDEPSVLVGNGQIGRLNFATVGKYFYKEYSKEANAAVGNVEQSEESKE